MINHKLLVTVARKGIAPKIVKATKKAGAEGGTTILGRGTGYMQRSFLGIPIEPEREIVLTLIPSEMVESVLEAVARSGKFYQEGNGVAFVMNACMVAGIAHLKIQCDLDSYQGGYMERTPHELIITIVNRGNAELVVDAAREAGAGGGTIIYGRGTGIHEQAKLFSIAIEPEKDLVLTLIESDRTDAVLHAIRQGTGLDEPGKGIAMVLPVERTIGISRLCGEEIAAQVDK
ncbi:P-II family nitrogen regulator [Desulfurispira natronophila]|uniref:Nitrogen regulatory protein PII n=1 Tax=Desulfurispira natronophila TaxID=682562 RepID=A0A7W8DFT6_9BACT|nr:P-II family nitrogen regulator [Desulfurispira natronophila]MBB5020732.1 nitrogen regulatory protein PII [Desulfurispira natronophila]